MNLTLDSFAARIRDILRTENTPAGREHVAALLRDALQDSAFVDSLFDADPPERNIVHEDDELGFCVVAHSYTRAKEDLPHDHGPSWAIYGQADGQTVMSDWARVESAADGARGKAKKLREYAMDAGSAHVYNEGDIHAARRDGPTRLVRVEGTDLARVVRGRYEPVGA